MEFIPLASSSAGNSYIVRASGLPDLLIDAGVRFQIIQEALDFRVTEIAGCLVSHGHSDHCAAVPDLLKAGVNVFGSHGFWGGFKGGKHKDHHRAMWVKDGHEFQVGPWRVLPFEVPHDDGTDTFGFIVAGGGGKLLYLTDAAWSPGTFTGLTHMAVECNWDEETMRANSAAGRIDPRRFARTASTHFSLPRLKRFLERMIETDPTFLQTLQEVHLLHLSDENSDEKKFKTEIAEIVGVPVYVAAKNARTEVR